jgi:hypothetical protein
MGKKFQKLVQPLKTEAKDKTRLFELIHSNVIGPMPTPMMRGFRLIFKFPDNYSRYTEVYFRKAKSDAPEKFNEYVALVENLHSKVKVCRICVDGGGEYWPGEKFLEYLAEGRIIKAGLGPYSPQQSGLSERCTGRSRTLYD